MKKYLKGMMAGFLGLIAFLGTKAVHAAADADLASGFASTTAIFTDNKSAIIDWLVGIFLVLIVITLIFGGGRRRR